MYAGVPTIWPSAGEEGVLGQLHSDRLGDAEVDDLDHRHSVVQRHHDVGRLDVAMDDALVVRVLDGMANRDEELEPLWPTSTGSGRRTR